MSETFVITGMVREKESRIGLPDLIVRAYDKDLLYDDLIGEDRTSCDGGFRIVSDAEDFRDFFDKRPDIYLRIMVPGRGGAAPREVFNTASAVRWNAKHLEYIVVEIPHSIAHDLPSAAQKTTTIMEAGKTTIMMTITSRNVATTSITSRAIAHPSRNAVTSI